MMRASLTYRQSGFSAVLLACILAKGGASSIAAQPAPQERPAPPRIEGIVSEPGLVRLTWSGGPETASRGIGYHVYRRDPGVTDFIRRTMTPAVESVFTDETVEPCRMYEYAVSAVCRAHDGTEVEGPRGEPRSIRSAAPFVVALRHVSRFPPEIPGGEALLLARVTVRKLEAGTWVSKDYTLRRGDRIGRMETVVLREVPRRVDFSTGFTVLSIESYRIARPTRVRRDIIDPKSALRIGDEEVIVDREVPAWKLIYRDDAGATREIVGAAAEDATPAPAKTNSAATTKP